MSNKLIGATNFTKLFGKPKRGKVRDVYDLGDKLLIIVTDRISAFDVILPSLILDKGRVLNQLSVFWFRYTEDIVENHLLEYEAHYYPPNLQIYEDTLRGRSMLVLKAETLPVECVVRGYLAGSGWEDYKNGKPICGITLPAGMVESQKLEEPIFTPTTKAETGHDLPITMEELEKKVGKEEAWKLRETSLQLYKEASEFAESRGIIIADTKFEFGLRGGKIILIDEALTPDSSRFWSLKDYVPGRSQVSFDKQPVRDYLDTLPWDKTYPGPKLPRPIVFRTVSRYREIFRIITGEEVE
jgi:phosphoribosylaminoimidazole-succinocarboxamide synthase